MSLLAAFSTVYAAESNPTTQESTYEAVQPTTHSDDATLGQLRAAIEAESDPELKNVMKEQLQLVESGQLDLHTLEASTTERGSAQAAGAQVPAEQHGGPRLVEGLVPTGGLLGQPADGAAGGFPAERLPAEVRTQLEKLFQEKGTGEPSKDANVRAEAERILKENGIDPREMGAGHEGKWAQGREQGQQGGAWRDTNRDNLDDNTGSVLDDGIGRGGDSPFRDERGEGAREAGTEALQPSSEGIEHMAPEARE